MSVQLLVVGEALIDDVHTPDGTRRRHPGGSPLNVAVGLARLGRSVGLLTRYGSDDDGALLASCRALMRSLDPYCAVVTEDRRTDLPWGDQPVGIGLELARP